jgi:putative ABC transport system substrate-binding protein
LETAFEQIAAQKIDAAVVQPTLPRQAVVALASRHKLPTGLPAPGYAHLGGFISYSGRGTEMAAVAAAQVDQIFKGTKPADIPVRQPTRFELVLNLKTARAFDLAVSPLLLAQADEVIE